MFRFSGSVMLRGGRGAADRYRWHVWGALAVFQPHWVCPCSTCFPHLLRLLAALCGTGPELRAVPVFRYSTKVQTPLGLHFVPSPAQAAQAARSLTGALSPDTGRLIPPRAQPQFPRTSRVLLVSVLGSWTLATTLLADVNHSESQEVFG